MPVGYMRASKADGSQVLGLQRDALLADGVKPDRLYEDHASAKRGQSMVEALRSRLPRSGRMNFCAEPPKLGGFTL